MGPCTGEAIRWDKGTPWQIRLSPGKSYLVRYTLNVRAGDTAEDAGTILLRISPRGAFTEALPLRFSMERMAHGPQALRYVAVLRPCIGGGCGAELSLVLQTASLCVEQAVMDVAEI